jgi:electron transfer flavoprotein alpha subunit
MILGFVEHDRGEPDELSLEMLTLARRLAGRMRAPLEAVAIGREPGPLPARVSGFGVSTLHVATDDRLDSYAPEAWARSIAELIEKIQPEVAMAAGTDRGQEVMAHLAAWTDLPLAANCVDARPGDPFVVIRQRWGGTLLEEARLRGAVKLLTVAEHAVPAEQTTSGVNVEVEVFEPTLSEGDFRVRVTDRVERAAGKASLTSARVVVGGGRGMGSAEGFRALEELADLLGGAVGCSRAVTSAGWRPHTDQVGQTGVRIAPDLYIACGISGATQHIVGCKGAKRILVINTDDAAPILSQADYAVIGDAGHVVDAISAEIKKARTGSG